MTLLTRTTALFIGVILFGCSSSDATSETTKDSAATEVSVAFETIDNLPLLYSYHDEDHRTAIESMQLPELRPEEIDAYIPEKLKIEGAQLHALHQVNRKQYTLRTFIARDKDAWPENPTFNDILFFVLYDLDGTIKDAMQVYFFPDEYGSYSELEINTDHSFYYRSSDWEYSPDPEFEAEAERTGYEFHPNVYEERYQIALDRLEFELMYEHHYPDPTYY